MGWGPHLLVTIRNQRGLIRNPVLSVVEIFINFQISATVYMFLRLDPPFLFRAICNILSEWEAGTGTVNLSPSYDLQ